MIGIVGGGISGLLVARELQSAGIPWMLFEASDRAGGVIYSGRVDGRVLDWGPQRTRLTGPIRTLTNELGIQDRVVEAPPGLDLMVYRDGRLRSVPFGIQAFLRSDLVGPLSKLRMLMEPLTAGARPGERVAEFFVRKFGNETYQNLMGPLYGGLYASDPRDMEADRMLVPMLRRAGISRSLVLSLMRKKGGRLSPPPACSFDEGMQVLPTALAAHLGENVRLDDGVRRLTQGSGGGWRLDTSSGSYDFSDVVVCTPTRATAKLLGEAAPQAARRIDALKMNPLGVVHLDVADGPRGMGFQVGFGEGIPLKGVTYNASLFGRRGVHTAYLGGAQHPDVIDLSDVELSDLASKHFTRITRAPVDGILDVSRTGIPAWDLSWRALDGLELPDGLHLSTNWESRPGLPGRFTRAAAVVRQIQARMNPTPHREVAA